MVRLTKVATRKKIPVYLSIRSFVSAQCESFPTPFGAVAEVVSFCRVVDSSPSDLLLALTSVALMARSKNKNIDEILQKWPYEPNSVSVRMAQGS